VIVARAIEVPVLPHAEPGAGLRRQRAMKPAFRLPRVARAAGLGVLLSLAMACAAPGSSGGTTPAIPGPPSSISGTVTAGPVCPVEHNPPASGCAPRAVAGATIVVSDSSGTRIASATTGPDGSYLVPVGRTGSFTVSGEPVTGLMGIPEPVSVSLSSAAGIVARANLEYDTGIR
jgi:hypothetical protein